MKLSQETIQETTKDKIIKLLNKGDSTIKEHLFNLKKEGLIKRFGSTKSGHWEVLDD